MKEGALREQQPEDQPEKIKESAKEFAERYHLSPEEMEGKIVKSFAKLNELIDPLLEKKDQLPSEFVEGLEDLRKDPANIDIEISISWINKIRSGLKIPKESKIREEVDAVINAANAYDELLHTFWRLKEIF